MIKNRYYPLSNGNTDFVKVKNNRAGRAFQLNILHFRSGEKMGFISFNEKYYLQKYQEGDSQAKNILIEHNLRLVVYIAKKF